MFGFDSGSVLARNIEVLLKVASQLLLKSQPADSHKFIKQLELLIVKLRQELAEPNQISHNLLIAATDSPQLVSLNAKILLVDNDLKVQTIIKTLLAPLGGRIICLENQGHFWGMLRSSRPDFLILDMGIPTANGPALCRSVREDPDWNWLPILFLTASDDLATRQEVFTVGADDYITKPIVPEELSTRIVNRIHRVRVLRTGIN
jgi:CheY-like chemotaxis protein